MNVVSVGFMERRSHHNGRMIGSAISGCNSHLSAMRLILIFCLFITCSMQAQNLVSNASFEQLTQCPDEYGQVYLASGWFNAHSSPDLFTACTANAELHTPSNAVGYQVPSDGLNYIGLWAYGICSSPSFCDREFIGKKLDLPLVVGQAYTVSFKVSCTSSFPSDQAVFGYAVNNLGMIFSMDSLTTAEDWEPYIDHPEVYSSAIVSDTSDWTVITGTFTAAQPMRYVYVGNFFLDQHTDTLRLFDDPDLVEFGSYYFVDDVCVRLATTSCDDVQVEDVPSASGVVFITFDDGIQLQWDNAAFHPEILRCWDAAGRVVRAIGLNSTETNHLIMDLSPGIYVIEMISKEERRTLRGCITAR